ncbi:hypothetical protein BGZ61DRAFT_441338 [Ilyonectria robusta]|uniref:uncharacterized protein n=1 Tax=Ilyonectria robusta TaxID=1079257 RepID=UPI001E8D5973|nr:uncharacterized protein BGZ61DRAFT_441338 [Ilyonectria robusta]KAH8735971.1 hypothetical protein BGZ61DRAFT_441338 [Ilyonectria robusta]
MRGHGRRRALPRVGIAMTRRHDDHYQEDGRRPHPLISPANLDLPVSHSCFHSCCRLPVARRSRSLSISLPFTSRPLPTLVFTALRPSPHANQPKTRPRPANCPARSLIYAKAPKSQPPKRHCPPPEAEGYASLREHRWPGPC